MIASRQRPRRESLVMSSSGICIEPPGCKQDLDQSHLPVSELSPSGLSQRPRRKLQIPTERTALSCDCSQIRGQQKLPGSKARIVKTQSPSRFLLRGWKLQAESCMKPSERARAAAITFHCGQSNGERLLACLMFQLQVHHLQSISIERTRKYVRITIVVQELRWSE